MVSLISLSPCELLLTSLDLDTACGCILVNHNKHKEIRKRLFSSGLHNSTQMNKHNLPSYTDVTLRMPGILNRLLSLLMSKNFEENGNLLSRYTAL